MILIVLIAVMWIVCMVLYKSGFKFFLFWLATCAAIGYFVDPSLGVWGFIGYFIIIGSDLDESSGTLEKKVSGSHGDSISLPLKRAEGQRGTSYNTGGAVRNLPNGNSAVRYDKVTYMSNKIRSVQEGMVTYYFDDNTDKRLGRSVDMGNGVHVYFDDNNREIGHSYTSGRITDFIDDCFETR